MCLFFLSTTVVDHIFSLTQNTISEGISSFRQIELHNQTDWFFFSFTKNHQPTAATSLRIVYPFFPISNSRICRIPSHNWSPRRVLTINMAIGSIVKHLTPISLLAALLYAPPELLEQYLGSDFLQTTWPTIVKPIMQTLIGLGVVRTLNASLNALATNNWRISSTPPNNKRWDWPNEIAVVTGGCGGIGLALVEGLTAKGVRVAVLDVAAPPPALKTNAKAVYFKCDVTSLSAVAETADAVRKTMGGDPSILINNAGVAKSNSILDIAETDLRRVLGVNLLAMWFTVKQFLPAMVRNNKGHVVTVASLASFVALADSIEYSATKAGALAFHEGLACEIKNIYKAPGIVTTIAHPNFVRTPMTEPYAERIERTLRMLKIEDVSRPLLAQIFSGRGGQLVMPSSLTFLSGLRGWPSWMQEGFRDIMGRGSRGKK